MGCPQGNGVLHLPVLFSACACCWNLRLVCFGLKLETRKVEHLALRPPSSGLSELVSCSLTSDKMHLIGGRMKANVPRMWPPCAHLYATPMTGLPDPG